MKACWPGASLEDFLCFRVTDTFPAMSNKLNAQAKPLIHPSPTAKGR